MAEPARRHESSRGAGRHQRSIRPDAAAVRCLIASLNADLVARGEPGSICLPPPRSGREVLSNALVAALGRTRDRDVFEFLYLLNVDSCTDYCAARLRGAPQVGVEDVVGETFLRVFRHASTFDPDAGAGFAAWLIVIAESQVREALRMALRSSRKDCAVPEVAGVADEPPSAAIARELRENLDAGFGTLLALCAAGLMTLPPRWRTAIELREGEGLSYEAIAARMGIGRTLAGMMIRRARMRVLGVVRNTLSQFEENR